MNRLGRALLCFLFNLLLSWRWSLPAWILLALHFWCGLSLWWFVGGVAFWVLSILCGMWITRWAASCSSAKDPPKENKNPYSAKS